MKIEKVLEKLNKLLAKWGIDEWILTAEYAFRLLGYDIPVRKGHLNIFVKQSSIPWNVRNELETVPPVNSKMYKELEKFMKNTEFEFDIIPRDSDTFAKYLKSITKYELDSGIIINIQPPVEETHYIGEMLDLCEKGAWGSGKATRLLNYIDEQINAFEKRNEKENVLVFEKIKKQYGHLRNQINRTTENAQTSVRGTGIDTGTVRGVVKIVSDADISLNENDVLVTSMTSPKFIPLIKKSSAVVTDEGGQLSHAAVSAREMEKPCVIGTEIATKVFKDGDMVEVDAAKGIVRKL